MRYKVIAIEREYASGGREIGEKLAQKLGVRCYGQEILERAAAETGFSQEDMATIEESMTGSLLFSLHMLASVTAGKGVDLTRAQALALAETNIIRDLANTPCVIVGRCAAGVLRNQENALRVFVHADDGARVERATQVYGVEPKQADAALRRFDRRRSNYFKTVAGTEWKDGDIYHLMLNSGKLGIDPSVEILAAIWRG